jgi:hypothetical protein
MPSTLMGWVREIGRGPASEQIEADRSTLGAQGYELGRLPVDTTDFRL